MTVKRSFQALPIARDMSLLRNECQCMCSTSIKVKYMISNQIRCDKENIYQQGKSGIGYRSSVSEITEDTMCGFLAVGPSIARRREDAAVIT